MCGRFALKENPKKLAEYFHAADVLEFSPSWNIAPSTKICTITDDENNIRHLRRMRWGLPSWAKDGSKSNKLSNARGETVAEKPSFRNAFKYRRCIIPASGFFEWKTDKGIKYPWFISYKSGEPFAFAGLWESWHPQDGETEDACCIITTEANKLMQPIHDRMPVILDPDQWNTWLSPKEKQSEVLLPMIRSHDPKSMQVWPVTRELNRVGLRDDAGLIERI